MPATPNPADPPALAYVIRSCKPDMTSASKQANGFTWPTSGPVECSDWDPKPECGHGLHGLLWGIGDWSLCQIGQPDAKWLVVEVEAGSVVAIGDKVKFPRGNVVYCGALPGAQALLAEKRLMHFASQGDSANHTAGYGAPASTAGYGAPASTAGGYAPASTAGYGAPASTAGYRAPASTAGYGAPASTAGDHAPASTAGDHAPASTAGYGAPASTAGYGAPASTAGEHSVACCLGIEGRARAGLNGSIILTRWDGQRYRHAVGYVGESGIEAGVWYVLDSDGELVKAANQGEAKA